jgi:hypothetical protein
MPHFETTSARELAEYQSTRIAELEADLKANQAALRELQTRFDKTVGAEAGRDLAAVAKALA